MPLPGWKPVALQPVWYIPSYFHLLYYELLSEDLPVLQVFPMLIYLIQKMLMA
jgi:hypothetical protein